MSTAQNLSRVLSLFAVAIISLLLASSANAQLLHMWEFDGGRIRTETPTEDSTDAFDLRDDSLVKFSAYESDSLLMADDMWSTVDPLRAVTGGYDPSMQSESLISPVGANIQNVPEPSTFLLAGLGSLAWYATYRRRLGGRKRIAWPRRQCRTLEDLACPSPADIGLPSFVNLIQS